MSWKSCRVTFDGSIVPVSYVEDCWTEELAQLGFLYRLISSRKGCSAKRLVAPVQTTLKHKLLRLPVGTNLTSPESPANEAEHVRGAVDEVNASEPLRLAYLGKS